MPCNGGPRWNFPPGTHQLTVSAPAPQRLLHGLGDQFVHEQHCLSDDHRHLRQRGQHHQSRLEKSQRHGRAHPNAFLGCARTAASVTERDANNSGYNWTATYDGLSRRLSTTSVLVTNGVAFTNFPHHHQFVFRSAGGILGTRCFLWHEDRMETLRAGPERQVWRAERHGWIRGGVAVSEFVRSDHQRFSRQHSGRGDQRRGVVESSAAHRLWRGAGLPAFGFGQWRQHCAVIRMAWALGGHHRLLQFGLRPYDPVSGRWLTYDSVWNERDPNDYTFCGGDPINGFDADGRGFWGRFSVAVGTTFMLPELD